MKHLLFELSFYKFLYIIYITIWSFQEKVNFNHPDYVYSDIISSYNHKISIK